MAIKKPTFWWAFELNFLYRIMHWGTKPPLPLH